MTPTEVQDRFSAFVRNDVIGAMACKLIDREERSEVDGLKLLVVMLAEQKKAAMDRIIELDAIAPRRVRSDGKVFRFDIPDEFVPIVDCTSDFK